MAACRHAVALAGAIVALASGLGCNDNELGIERRRPNRPPETILSSSPPDSTAATSYRVRLYWSAADADGTVDHYDYILVDHPAARSSIDGDPDDPNRVVVTVPDAADPRWQAVAGNDTVIVASADTLRHDPEPPDSVDTDPEIAEHNRLVRRRRFERWHTFFVRAVDNEGAVDPTPEYVSFNSTTLAPEVRLTAPIDAAEFEFSGPQIIVFNWDGQDPVGDGTFVDPIASRYTSPLVAVRRNSALEYVGYPDTLYDLPPSGWSRWRRWDAADGSGRRAISERLESVEGTTRGYYLFAVQAMDEAGAVTPVFDATTPDRNNVVRVAVFDGFGATLIVDDPFLGQYHFAGASAPRVLAIAAGQPVRFHWRGDASAYGGSIVAYRYGWNLSNLDDDQQWDQNWCATCTTAPQKFFIAGRQRFYLETRDNAGTVTRGVFELDVHQVTRRRDLLVVDDTDIFPGQELDEAVEDERWATVIARLRVRQPFQFDARGDVYDVVANSNEPPPISTVFDYKSVVWCARAANSSIALQRIAAWFDPFVSDSRNRARPFNYLMTYIHNKGELWLSGAQLTSYLWTFPSGQLEPYPFNVTNWDDPNEPHPHEDSVGVSSLLWRMGAEAVDIGGGGQAQEERQGIEHFCVGFRRATPQGHETQTFVSSTREAHQHELVVPTADVDRPPPVAVTLTTQAASGTPHTHTVTLTPDQLRQLARGDRLHGIETSQASLPVPHTHVFDLVDRIGLWGAPARLVPQLDLWAQPDADVNPYGGRPSIEIYNMPAFMVREQPRLNPDPSLWEPLYSYMSATPLDPANEVLYPQTADGEASVIVRKASAFEPYYSRALCGFEVWRLHEASHEALADFILLRHFRLGLPDG